MAPERSISREICFYFKTLWKYIEINNGQCSRVRLMHAPLNTSTSDAMFIGECPYRSARIEVWPDWKVPGSEEMPGSENARIGVSRQECRNNYCFLVHYIVYVNVRGYTFTISISIRCMTPRPIYFTRVPMVTKIMPFLQTFEFRLLNLRIFRVIILKVGTWTFGFVHFSDFIYIDRYKL